MVSPLEIDELNIYRESVGMPDAEAYCARQASRVGEAGGCPERGVRVRLHRAESRWSSR